MPTNTAPSLRAVALLSPPYATLTYAVPPWLPPQAWRRGTRVAVPLGNGAVRVGVLLDDESHAAASGGPNGGADGRALPEGVVPRPMLWPLEREPLLDAGYLDMVRQLALRQAASEGQILGNFLPVGLRTTQVRLRFFEDGRARTLKFRDLAPLADKDPSALHRLGQAWLEGRGEVLDKAEDAADAELCAVTADPPWPVRPSAVRQVQLLEYLWEKGSASRRAVLRDLGAAAATALEGLLKRGLVAVTRRDEADCACDEAAEGEGPACLYGPPDASFELNASQRAALDDFLVALDGPRAEHRLLYGVTGSGKTAVYLDLARECLARGRSVMLLAPEVALACKLRRDVDERLPGAPMFFFHGYQGPSQRERTFRALAARREPCLIVGTRSALFLPAPDLGVVVLDEEHDTSFKQDEGLAYQAKEVAWFRVGQGTGLLVLGSATPDVKTFHAMHEGRLPMAALPERAGGGTLPDVELVDIKDLASTDSVLAAQSGAALRETVQRGEQAVILLNRRGYAPLMYCLDCGTVARCPHCDIGLTYHKGRERLVCHYCGHSVPYPATCPNCKCMHYLPMGEGTEKLEETLAALLPAGGKVLRLDRDSTRRPGRMEEILGAFARREAQVLVGTQMLSKGHHFPDVTLAVVADGDLGLNLPDYRAAERTFQLLVQSAGRAGRGEKPGRVLIQTRDPSHYCWNFVRTADYEGFYAHEIAIRQRRRYPPFVRLALVRISYPMDFAGGQEELARFANAVRAQGRERGVQVLGPAPSPLPLLRGRKRFQCLLKADDWPSIRALFAAAGATPGTSHLRISLDLDPVNMM